MSDTEEHGQDFFGEETPAEEAPGDTEADTQDTPQPQTPVVMPESREGLSFIEDLQKKKGEQLQEDMDEYEAARKEEKQKEADEIAELKRKREERLKERAEEEKRMAGQRKEEEARRKAEEEERKKRKIEDEAKRKAEKERRRKEAEARAGPKTPNFTIVKKEKSGGQDDDEDEKAPQKSKEELEKEKQATLAQRIQPLAIDGLDVAKLKEAAQNFYDKVKQLVSNKYDLEERFKRQQYDMTELRERARQMSKVKKRGVATVQVDDAFDPNAERFSNAPPKVLVASKFERNLDRRTWGEKLTCYASKQDFDISYKPYYAFN